MIHRTRRQPQGGGLGVGTGGSNEGRRPFRPTVPRARVPGLDARLRALLRSIAALHFQPESVLPARTGSRRLGLSAGRLARPPPPAAPLFLLGVVSGGGRGPPAGA